jgi:hypothetical protein
MKVIDFTHSRWGHALHGDTFWKTKAKSRRARFADWLLKRRRYSVLFHCSQRIAPGDIIRYRTESGFAEARVVGVDWYQDPRDMGKLEILIVEGSK